jgi:tripartite ATP-independent transporter DctM subunit
METLLMGALLLAIMLLLLAGGVWIAMTLAIVGWIGQAFFTNTMPGKNLFSAFWESNASWELAALPLFIWMGEILFRTKLSEEMFEGLRPWLNRVPGRLMHTTVLGCGVFGSVSGSSAATCATIAKVALPELKRRGYNEQLAIGSLATAGTLGILIPPSITMVVYAVAADASIIRIFLAGFLPGLLLMALFSGYIGWWSLRHPDQVPPADPPCSFMEKLRKSGSLIPVSLLIVFIVWVLVAGWATATECAAFGALGSLAIAAWGRSLTWKNFTEGLMGATRTSCMIMFILAGAAFLTKTMAFHWHPARTGRVGQRHAAVALRADRRAGADLPGAGHGAGRHLHDRADQRGGAADDPESRVRPDLVRHLHHPAGGDRRGHAAGRLQPVRAAEHDGQGQQRDRQSRHSLLHLPGDLHRVDHAVPADRDHRARPVHGQGAVSLSRSQGQGRIRPRT